MNKSKSESERLKAIKLKINLNKNPNVEKNKSDADRNFEEYKKLRKPKPVTFLKIHAHQIKKPAAEDKDPSQVPLRQEFLNKKEQLEKATTDILKKYELRKSQGNLLDDDIFSQDSDEAQPFTLRKDLYLRFKELDVKCEESNQNSTKNLLNSSKSLNYLEQHLVNILYTKVQAHPNGFFAENLPHWYNKTFDKNLPADWLELLKKSHRFYIEKVQNQIVLYTKNNCDDPLTDSIDLNAAGDNPQEVLPAKSKVRSMRTETSVGFVRYKHLQKSLQDYAAQNAGCNAPYASKSSENYLKLSDRLNKGSSTKRYNFVRK